jgi:hypothetical protein
VLGHILPTAIRVEALRQFGRLVSRQGKVFIFHLLILTLFPDVPYRRPRARPPSS